MTYKQGDIIIVEKEPNGYAGSQDIIGKQGEIVKVDPYEEEDPMAYGVLVQGLSYSLWFRASDIRICTPAKI